MGRHIPWSRSWHGWNVPPLESVAQLVESDPSAVIQTLKASGIEVETPGQTIAEIAEKNGKRPMDVLLILFSDRSSTQHKSRRG